MIRVVAIWHSVALYFSVNPLAKTRRINSKNIQISIEPTPRQQLQESPQGIAGQFRIRYDVTRGANDAGEFQVGGQILESILDLLSL